MEYDDSLRWLLTLPDFERTGDFAARPDIAPMLALLRELGDPHLGAPSTAVGVGHSSQADDLAELKLRRYCPVTVHIAGSKGKGSTGAMIEAVLRASGLRTGHYISPHLHRYTERIRIDGQPISREGFASAMTAVRAAIEIVAPKYPDRHLLAFDALTAAAFVAFREASVGVQVIEVGLGGLLDSTNVFHVTDGGAPEKDRSEDLSVRTISPNDQRPIVDHGGLDLTAIDDNPPHIVVLTPISLEHTAILGDTVQMIARQKAGIITEGCTVVVAPQRESAIDVFAEVARERHATLIEVAKVCQLQRTSANAEGQEFRLKTSRETYAAQLPLAGRHQLDNAATAIIAAEELAAQISSTAPPLHVVERGLGGEVQSRRESPIRAVNPAAVKAGLAALTWPGRLETLKRKPLVIVDGAHNGDSVKRMVAALREDFGLKSAVLLFGTLTGKEVAAMAEQAAPFASAIFVTAWPSARAADARETAAVFASCVKDRSEDLSVRPLPSLGEAYEAAIAEAGERGAVVAFGALAFVAAVREYVLGIEGDRLLVEGG